MLMVAWSGAAERAQECQGLSRYDGPSSSLWPAIDAREGLDRGDVLTTQSWPTPKQGAFWGKQPNKLSDERRAKIKRYLVKGRTVGWIVRKMRCSTVTVVKVRREGAAQ